MERPALWDEYEEAVMSGNGDDAVAPGDDYEMSERFKDWLVEQLRDDVLGQLGGLGAVVKANDDARD